MRGDRVARDLRKLNMEATGGWVPLLTAETRIWEQSNYSTGDLRIFSTPWNFLLTEILRQDNIHVFQQWWMDGGEILNIWCAGQGYKISLFKCLPNETTLILNCTFVLLWCISLGSHLPVQEDFYKVVKRSKTHSACSLQSVFVCLSVWYPSVNAHAITGHSKQSTQIRTQYRAMWRSWCYHMAATHTQQKASKETWSSTSFFSSHVLAQSGCF